MSQPEDSVHVFRIQFVVICDDHKAEQFEALLEEHLEEMKAKIFKKLGMDTKPDDDDKGA